MNVPPAPTVKLPPGGIDAAAGRNQRAGLHDRASRVAVAAAENQGSVGRVHGQRQMIAVVRDAAGRAETQLQGLEVVEVTTRFEAKTTWASISC